VTAWRSGVSTAKAGIKARINDGVMAIIAAALAIMAAMRGWRHGSKLMRRRGSVTRGGGNQARKQAAAQTSPRARRHL
jgi:hypothetical protein